MLRHLTQSVILKSFRGKSLETNKIRFPSLFSNLRKQRTNSPRAQPKLFFFDQVKTGRELISLAGNEEVKSPQTGSQSTQRRLVVDLCAH